MPSKPTLKGIRTVEYLKRFPDTPSLTLAKKLYKENKELFRDLETARASIRYYTGKSGKINRRKVVDRSCLHTSEKSRNPFNLPESDEAVIEPFYMPIGNASDVLILSDIHIPYHNIEAVTLAIKYAKEHKVKTILLNGDIVDFHDLSKYEKNPKKRRFSEEIEALEQFLQVLKDETNAKIYYKNGNHEHRYERYLRVKAAELLDVSAYQFQELCKFGEKGIEFIEQNREIWIGEWLVLHGHEYPGGGGIHLAKSIWVKTQCNTICGHFHRKDTYSITDAAGKDVTVQTTGCMCELMPEYMPYQRADKKWTRGFCHLKNGKVTNYVIKNGELC